MFLFGKKEKPVERKETALSIQNKYEEEQKKHWARMTEIVCGRGGIYGYAPWLLPLPDKPSSSFKP